MKEDLLMKKMFMYSLFTESCQESRQESLQMFGVEKASGKSEESEKAKGTQVTRILEKLRSSLKCIDKRTLDCKHHEIKTTQKSQRKRE